MSSILVFGIGPYPTEAGAAVSGPTIRLRQFVEPLAAAGHDVSIVMLESRVRDAVEINGVKRAASLTPREILEPWKALKAVATPPVDAVFGVGSMMPVAAAARMAVHLDKPCWIDYFGDPLAEFHAGISRPGVKSDLVLRDHIWRFVREGLTAGDRFSAVSMRQRDALLGQLILLGKGTSGATPHARAITIPCGVPESWTRPTSDPVFPSALSELGLGPDSTYLYVGGSWTPWLDETRMGELLGHLLATEPGLELVVRGGPAHDLAGHIRQNFFAALGAKAPAGAVHEIDPREDVAEADLLAYASGTLLLDRDLPESHLGSRNRLLAFLRWGLSPVISTHSELASELVAAGLATAAMAGDPVRAVLPIRQVLHRTSGERRELRRRGLAYLRGVTFEETLKPVLEWVENPGRWPQAGDGEKDTLIAKWRRGGM
ncbi:MAG: hypothetical protein PWP23_3208 [Candidatus Sumerlaeota bacterium]|nr:hypothetical protein [Candidatus Sumerlaeota bacterium]